MPEHASSHLRTNAEVIARFLPVKVDITERQALTWVTVAQPVGEGWKVHVSG